MFELLLSGAVLIAHHPFVPSEVEGRVRVARVSTLLYTNGAFGGAHEHD